jgi:hypothetical protein
MPIDWIARLAEEDTVPALGRMIEANRMEVRQQAQQAVKMAGLVRELADWSEQIEGYGIETLKTMVLHMIWGAHEIIGGHGGRLNGGRR